MQLKRWIACLSVGLLWAGSVSAQVEKEQLQVPLCLATQLSASYSVLAEDKNFRIIEVPSADLNMIALAADKAECGRFINVTHRLKGDNKAAKAMQILQAPAPVNKVAKPIFKIKHRNLIKNAITHVQQNDIMDTLQHLTEYENRSATKKTGVDVAKWLKKTFDDYAALSENKNVKSFFVETGPFYKQPSLVTVIGTDLKGPGIVLGAHMDTLDGRMPGAGDDGSGSATIMEVAKVILDFNMPLKRPIYIIWYSAEERGLVGSQYVVDYFQENNIEVMAAMQFDMTGFRNDPNDPTMWVFRDYTDSDLTDFISDLITTYVDVPVAESACGYGCSDHASWTAAGVPAAFPCETDFEHHNSKIHTRYDTIDRLSPEHMTNFAILGLAYLFELAIADE